MEDPKNSPPDRQAEPELPPRVGQGNRHLQLAFVVVGLVIVLAVITVFMAVQAGSEASKDAPYTENPRRLQDVIAAIQLLGTYRWHNSTIEQWVDRLEPPRIKMPPTYDERGRAISHWSKVFRQHPERPLDSDQIEVLLATVIQLHSAEIARQQEGRWLVSSLFTLLGAILGGLLGALVGVGRKEPEPV